MGMKYSDIVDYDKLDPFKEECIRRFTDSLNNVNRFGMRIVPETIGETAVAIDADFFNDFLLVFGVEGLGTKNMIAEAMAEKEKIGGGLGLDRRKLFAGIGQDEMAMTLNDLSGIGAIPLVFEPIVATGSSDYLTDSDVFNGLIDGFERGARIARVAIPGGETPTLKGIVYPTTIDVAGGSMGIIRPKSRLCVGEELRAGLTLYGIQSSGIHSNGVSLARKIAEKSKDGYFTRIDDGRTIGESLLTPTVLYAPLVEALAEEGADIVYMQPITGHGWAKIMRKRKDLTYVIEKVPYVPREFRWLQENGPVDDEEAHRAWNMGLGWVLYAHNSQGGKIRRACEKCRLPEYEMGLIEEGERKVVIPSLDVTYRPGKKAA